MEVQKKIEDAVLKDVGDTVPKIEMRRQSRLDKTREAIEKTANELTTGNKPQKLPFKPRIIVSISLFEVNFFLIKIYTDMGIWSRDRCFQKVMRNLPTAVLVFHMVAVLMCACIYLSPEADASDSALFDFKLHSNPFKLLP